MERVSSFSGLELSSKSPKKPGNILLDYLQRHAVDEGALKGSSRLFFQLSEELPQEAGFAGSRGPTDVEAPLSHAVLPLLLSHVEVVVQEVAQSRPLFLPRSGHSLN